MIFPFINNESDFACLFQANQFRHIRTFLRYAAQFIHKLMVYYFLENLPSDILLKFVISNTIKFSLLFIPLQKNWGINSGERINTLEFASFSN